MAAFNCVVNITIQACVQCLTGIMCVYFNVGMCASVCIYGMCDNILMYLSWCILCSQLKIRYVLGMDKYN